MATSKSAEARRKRWRGRLEQWRRSGLTQAAFCRRHGLRVQQFCWWKRRLASEATQASPTFVPLGVVARAWERVELRLRGGRRLRFAATLEPARLAALAAALEGTPC